MAITYKTAVNDLTRFARSKAAGVHFGLTPKRYQLSWASPQPAMFAKQSSNKSN